MKTINPNTLSIYFTNKIYRIFADVSEKTYKLLFIFLLVFLAFFSGLKLYSGLSPVWAPWDVIVMLNGAWRIYSGQIPHTDFYNPIGPLSYIPTALIMKIGGISSSSLVYGNALLGAILALWTWYVSQKRLTALNAIIFSIFIYVLSVSSRPLGFGVTNTTYAMIYNRYGYALLSILFIQVFVRPEIVEKTEVFLDGFSVGVLLALLFYCKITYFLVGVAALAIGWIISKPVRRQLLYQGFGFVGLLVLIWLFFRVNPLDYINDIRTAALSQSLTSRFANLTGTIRENNILIYLMFPLLLLSFVALSGSTSSRDEERESRLLWLIVAFITVSEILITSGNAVERKDLPLFFTAGIIILNSLTRIPAGYPLGNLSNTMTVHLLAVLIVLPLFSYQITKDIASVIYSANWDRVNLKNLNVSQKFESSSMSDFIIPENSDWPTAYSLGKDVPQRLNDGFSLLKKHINKNSRIFCLCFTDPFSFGLGLAPARSTPLWWDETFSFTDKIYPQPQTLLANVDFVTIPIVDENNGGCCTSTVHLLEKIYGQYINNHFYEVDKSEYWILLERK